MQSLVLNDLHRVGDEPRVLDLRLAERLEFKAPRQIRELIKRNAEELERYGALSYGTTTPSGGGPLTTEYWLNEAQAVLLCMRSDAPRAPDVRAEIIAVFQAWRHGKLVPSAPTLDQIGVLFDQKLVPVREEIAGVRLEISDVRENVTFLTRRVNDMAPRHDFSANTRKQFVAVVARQYDGKCPICRKERIVDAQGREIPKTAHADHFNGHERNSPEDGWLVCIADNYKLERDPALRERARPHFRVYQDLRLEMFGTAAKQSSRKRSHSKTARNKQQYELDV